MKKRISLHKNKPKISRDNHLLQKETQKKKKISGERSFELYHKSLQGYDEVIKRPWEIIDSSKTDEKEKMKGIIQRMPNMHIFMLNF